MSTPARVTSLWPREKMQRYGIQALRDDELWALVLGQGRKGKSVLELGKIVAQHLNDKQLSLGRAQLARVQAVLELGRRQQQIMQVPIRSAQDLLPFLSSLAAKRSEHLLAFYGGTAGTILHQELLALGGFNVVACQPRDLLAPLALHPITWIIVAHNHPSGNPEPSPDDIVFTNRLDAACQLMGVELRDHLIIGKQKMVSLREEGYFNHG